MAGFSGMTGVPEGELQEALAQSTADAVAQTNALILNDTTWTGLLAKLRAGLNDQHGRAIALFVCYNATATSILTGGRVTSYMKGYVTLSGSGSNLYDFFGGALSNGDMYAWRIEASDSAPTIINFRRFVDYEQSTANVVSYVDIDLSGKAITSAENNVYYLADIDTGVAVPSGFRFVSAMSLAPWSAGISVTTGTRNNSGNLVVGATATKSLTVPSNRKFRVFYIVVE